MLNHDAQDPAKTLEFGLEEKPLYMFQEKGFYFSKTDPLKDCSFEIGRGEDKDDNIIVRGQRGGNWASLDDGRRGVSLAVRDFWQQYPKEIKISNKDITARLWSGRGGRELDFRYETMLSQWPTNWLNEALHGGGSYGSAYHSLMAGSKSYVLGLAKTHELISLSSHRLFTVSVKTLFRV